MINIFNGLEKEIWYNIIYFYTVPIRAALPQIGEMIGNTIAVNIIYTIIETVFIIFSVRLTVKVKRFIKGLLGIV